MTWVLSAKMGDSQTVFISYATENAGVAESLCKGLEQSGVSCWIAPRNIEPGISYPSAIVAGIQSSRSVVFILSENSNASPHIRSELELAFSNKIPILPCRIDSVEPSADLKYLLSTAQWLDAREGTIEQHLDQLNQALKDADKFYLGNTAKKRSHRWMVATGLALTLGIGTYEYFQLTSHPGGSSPPPIAAGPPGPTPTQPLQPKIKVNPADGRNYAWVPAGRFMMGCSEQDSECDDDEKPVHAVSVKGFWMGETEVTEEVYAIHTGGKAPPAGRAKLPVTDVTWAEARKYCEAIGGRLPTEAEWEYAARGGVPEPYYDDLPKIAWYGANSDDHVHEVAQKPPNAYGLYDMLGNVWELVLDRYFNQYDPDSTEIILPLAGNASATMRGGSWPLDRKAARVSNRAETLPDEPSEIVGFRCASDKL
jgi:formylglycine-generating enzyme required for sulfatase activity